MRVAEFMSTRIRAPPPVRGQMWIWISKKFDYSIMYMKWEGIELSPSRHRPLRWSIDQGSWITWIIIDFCDLQGIKSRWILAIDIFNDWILLKNDQEKPPLKHCYPIYNHPTSLFRHLWVLRGLLWVEISSEREFKKDITLTNEVLLHGFYQHVFPMP